MIVSDRSYYRKQIPTTYVNPLIEVPAFYIRTTHPNGPDNANLLVPCIKPPQLIVLTVTGEIMMVQVSARGKGEREVEACWVTVPLGSG